MTVWAIIPARGGSKGIPRKNLKLLGGKPLVAYAIDQAKQAATIDRVLVSTEDAEIRAVAERCGAETMDRVEEFIHDNSTQEVDRLLAWIVKQLELKGERVDVVVLLYPTAPLRKIETIDEAVSKVTMGGYDSVLSLYEDATYLWRRNGDTVEPVNYDPKTRGPRQKENWNQWAENKAIYVMRRDLLVETGCRLGGRIGYVEMGKADSVDIDRPDDLAICEAILTVREQ